VCVYVGNTHETVLILSFSKMVICTRALVTKGNFPLIGFVDVIMWRLQGLSNILMRRSKKFMSVTRLRALFL